MIGTIIDRVKLPSKRGGGNGYIVLTDEGEVELWTEEALELEKAASTNEQLQALKKRDEIRHQLERS